VNWLIWVAIALVAGVLEVTSLQFVLAMFAGGALTAALAAAVGTSVELQVITFAAGSAVLLLGARPPLVRWSRRTAGAVTGVAALVGRRAEVLVEVTHVQGRVKLGGETWSARTDEPGLVLSVGMNAYVQRIDGATAVVTAEPPPVSATTSTATEPPR
jgi:membrane protein implicated in regulation of membrane protease activity